MLIPDPSSAFVANALHSPLLQGLNEEQLAAVTLPAEHALILAGAGSGKTRVLTTRIAWLLQTRQASAGSLMAVTFTNKAAKEMRNRIEQVAGPQARNLWMGTFHSVFARILRQESDRLGYPSNFTIYDSEDSKNLLKGIIKEMNLDDKTYKPSMVLGRISHRGHQRPPQRHFA